MSQLSDRNVELRRESVYLFRLFFCFCFSAIGFVAALSFYHYIGDDGHSSVATLSLSSYDQAIVLPTSFALEEADGSRPDDEDEEPEDSIDEFTISDFDRAHWSYRPIVRPTLPTIDDVEWAANPIDLFVRAKHESLNVTPQPTATAEVLLRRVTFDLLGRPPSLEERQQFLEDIKQGAYGRVVDRLIASPEFGIRWAQHWLDVARFAETDGFEHDKTRPEAWKYRDWVVDSLNANMPYDDFIRMQLAGDEWRPGDVAAQIATGFCLSGPDMPDINEQDERKHNLLNEMTGTVGAVFLGMQIGCAQCHNHVYDPISQGDFYRLRAIFDPSIHLRKDRSVRFLEPPISDQHVSHLMIRGEWHRTGPEVPPAFPRIANPADASFDPVDGVISTAGRRIQLADWLCSDQNPLTARVIVNRIWHHHFGQGLSRTPSDFGIAGDSPSHPELLDWLAAELIETEWNLKNLHRLIVTSSTYRQRAAASDTSVNESDPTNRWLTRFQPRRLSGEVIRDAMLSMSGVVVNQMGGAGVRPPLPEELTDTLLTNQWVVTADESQHYRRSIYLFARRNLKYPIFDVFDRPDANASCPLRNRSTTATQSLFLLNGMESFDLADRFATRLVHDYPNDSSLRTEALFLFAFSRQPRQHERDRIVTFLREFPDQAVEQEKWRAICLAIFNANEFVYVD